MVRRSRTAVFGGMFVFPGGMVDPVDHGSLAREALGGEWTQDTAWRAAGLRETAEEVGIFLADRAVSPPPRPLKGEEVYRWVLGRGARLDPGRLRYLSNWIAPRPARKRFDVRFYLALVEGDEDPLLARAEVTEAVWTRPSRALRRFRRGEWEMILPTRKTLEYLQEFPTSAQAWDSVDETRPVPPLLVRVVRRRGRIKSLMPGDPGYEEAE